GQVPQFVPTRPVGPGPVMAGGLESFNGDVPEGWDRVQGWQGVQYTGAAARDTEQKHGGASSLRLTNSEVNQIVQVSRNVMVGAALQAGHTYRLSAWLRSRGLAQPGGIMLGLFAPELKSTGGARLDYPAETAGWARSEATFTVAPATEMLRIMIHLQGPGTVWIDDLALEEQRPGGGWGEVMRPERPADHELMRQWVELVHGAGRPYLLLGRMLHPPHLECAVAKRGERAWPAILHNAYAAPDGSRAVVLVNATDEPQTGRLTWRGRVVSVALEPWEVRLAR
ncbi:MAG: hypothetical protein HYU66_18410, partial [Armatimonadetes bacterium]|nr:hypothetical protein [Armatimonadota bacterium]